MANTQVNKPSNNLTNNKTQYQNRKITGKQQTSKSANQNNPARQL